MLDGEFDLKKVIGGKTEVLGVEEFNFVVVDIVEEQVDGVAFWELLRDVYWLEKYLAWDHAS